MPLKVLLKHHVVPCVTFRSRILCSPLQFLRCGVKGITSVTTKQRSYLQQLHCTSNLRILHQVNILHQPSTCDLLYNQNVDKDRKYSTSVQKSVHSEEEAVKDVVHHLAESISNVSATENDATELVMFLLNSKVHPEQIKSLLMENRKLMMEPLETWKTAFQTLKNLGFHSDQLLPAVITIPAVFKGNLRKLIQTMDTLRALGFREKQIAIMILNHPQLLNHPSKKIIQQYNHLLQLFNKNGVVHMLLRNPSLFMVPMDELRNRLLYVQDVMHTEQGQMIKSNFLRHDILHIYSRHQFLLRAGRYSTPNKHGEVKFKNPTLKDIVDTSDQYFARRVAGLTLDEYRTFVEICSMEMNYGKALESLDDDPSDDELEDDDDDVSDDEIGSKS